MKHTSINCCEFSVDMLTTDPETGRVMLLSMTWDELQAFVIEHGSDVTDKAREMLDTFLPVPQSEAHLPEGTTEDVATRDTPNGASDAERVGERPALPRVPRRSTGWGELTHWDGPAPGPEDGD